MIDCARRAIATHIPTRKPGRRQTVRPRRNRPEDAWLEGVVNAVVTARTVSWATTSAVRSSMIGSRSKARALRVWLTTNPLAVTASLGTSHRAFAPISGSVKNLVRDQEDVRGDEARGPCRPLYRRTSGASIQLSSEPVDRELEARLPSRSATSCFPEIRRGRAPEIRGSDRSLTVAIRQLKQLADEGIIERGNER